MKRMMALIPALLATIALAMPADAQAAPRVAVHVSVPLGRVWIPAAIVWDASLGRSVHRAGHWAAPPHASAKWISGHWAGHARGRHWVPGHWVPR